MLVTTFTGSNTVKFVPPGLRKGPIFMTPVNDIGELRTRIRDVIATKTVEILSRTLQVFECRLDIVRATNVAHVEVN